MPDYYVSDAAFKILKRMYRHPRPVERVSENEISIMNWLVKAGLVCQHTKFVDDDSVLGVSSLPGAYEITEEGRACVEAVRRDRSVQRQTRVEAIVSLIVSASALAVSVASFYFTFIRELP